MKDIVEVWRPVVNYEDRYEVSSLGRVRSLSNKSFQKILVQRKNDKGYWTVTFNLDGKPKKFRVARLVAMAFLGPPTGDGIVLHGPAGKEDNSVLNLSWGTYRQNAIDRFRDGTMQNGEKHFNVKINRKIAGEIFDMYLSGCSKLDIAQKFSITVSNVSSILLGNTWKGVYAEKMRVPIESVYDMWAHGRKNAAAVNWIHLQKFLISSYACSIDKTNY